MPTDEIELDPVDFMTVGTVGPKGRRLFHLQAGKTGQLVSLVLEKEQARALAEALEELLGDLNQKYPDRLEKEVDLSHLDMSLRDPLEPMFRIAQMGLGYDEDRNMIVLVARELVAGEEEEGADTPEPRTVRFWASREQMRALSKYTYSIVKQGRADPKSNGHLIYYWT
jgi:uncharacterized repeat protein (TIGR03847 family)